MPPSWLQLRPFACRSLFARLSQPVRLPDARRAVRIHPLGDARLAGGRDVSQCPCDACGGRRLVWGVDVKRGWACVCQSSGVDEDRAVRGCTGARVGGREQASMPGGCGRGVWYQNGATHAVRPKTGLIPPDSRPVRKRCMRTKRSGILVALCAFALAAAREPGHGHGASLYV